MEDYKYGAFEFPPLNSPGDLRTLYDLTVLHNLLEKTFYNGGVETLMDFQFNMQDAHVYGAIYNHELVGFAWLNMWTGASAAVHICLWPTAPREEIVALGSLFLKHIFHLNGGEYRASLFGLTPVSYKNVIRYAELIGMTLEAGIPSGANVQGVSEDLVLLTVTKDEVK